LAGALIVAAVLGDADQAQLNALRQAYFPPERNQLPAHLTMFHALPPSLEGAARAFLAQLARAPRPAATLASIMDLGGGVAFKVESSGLLAIRQRIAEHFHGCLTAQDESGWRPHVTIQNKVARTTAMALRDDLMRDFRPRPLLIKGLGLHRYLGGPWELLGAWNFRG
jgi:hypothetical protein